MHPFHIVTASPWPLTGSLGLIFRVLGVVSSLHRHIITPLGFLLLVVTLVLWFRDIRREATYQGKHTYKVQKRVRVGILLFILSEVFFFLSFFWAYFHSSLSPEFDWPPYNIEPISPMEIPLLNTALLLSSGATITWAHMALTNSEFNEFNVSIMLTLILGTLFTCLQLFEYIFCTRPIIIACLFTLIAMNISVPPRLGLWAELLISLCVLNIFNYGFPFLILIFLLGFIYNACLYVSCMHSKMTTAVVFPALPMVQVSLLRFASFLCLDLFHLSPCLIV